MTTANEPPKSRIFTSPASVPPSGFSAVPPAWRVGARGNVIGGLLSTLVSLPLSMGLGVLAFSSFGPEFAARGVLAGIISAGFLGLIAVLMGARGAAIYAPRSLVSFMIAAVSADLFLRAKWLPADPDSLSAAIFLLMALSGAFQLAFGLGRLARIVKFIPTPVLAGFQNAAAITIALSQLPMLLGFAGWPVPGEWSQALEGFRPLDVVVGLAAVAMAFQSHRLTRKVPALVMGLVTGMGLYYLFSFTGFGHLLGPILGTIPVRLPEARELAAIMQLSTTPGFLEALPAIVLGAASLAVVGSLDVLISAKVVENMSQRRGNGTQELVSIGTANLVTPLLGGIAGSISLGASTAANKGGARNSLALLVHAAFFLALVPLLAPAIGYIPRVAIAALVFVAGVQLFDRWTLQLAARLARRQAIHWPSISIDLCVISLVSVIAIIGQVVAAVLTGVAVAIIVFTLRMSRSVIRREQYGNVLQSRRARVAADAALLGTHGDNILALQLEGPVFFASAEVLHNRVDGAIAEGVRYVILDVARVTELDSTGARILLQADDRLRAAHCRMIVCGAQSRPELAALLVDHGVSGVLTAERLFPDLDRALEWCEDDLLARHRSLALLVAEHAFEHLDLVRDVTRGDREALWPILVRREYAPGEAVFRQGDAGDALFVIARGSASVGLGLAGSGERRLMTFSQGTFFGEMAFLDREQRSATVTADEPLVCYMLERASFDRLAMSHPDAGLAVLANLARELSLRMRRANRTLVELT